MVLTIELALALVTTLVGVAGLAWGVIRWVLSQLASRDREIVDLRRSLDAHKLYAAERFATSEEVATAFGKVEVAIARLAEQIHGLLLTERTERSRGHRAAE